jgi:hypothetical protein
VFFETELFLQLPFSVLKRAYVWWTIFCLYFLSFMGIDAIAELFMSFLFLYCTFQLIYEVGIIYIICLAGNSSQFVYWGFNFLESFWLEFHLRKEDQNFLAFLWDEGKEQQQHLNCFSIQYLKDYSNFHFQIIYVPVFLMFFLVEPVLNR